jgi:DNA-binding transcriptional LysR family regulator
MDVNIPELKAFVAAAKFGNFTRAAESVNISQPALSRRISLVESALGAPVFERVGGGVQLTAVGEAFLSHAAEVLASLKDAVEAAHTVRRGERGELVVGVANSLLRTNVVNALEQFRGLRPGLDLILHTGTSAEISTLVLQGDALLGLRFRPDANPRLHSRIVGRDAMVVVCSPKHPLAGKKSVSRAQLSGEKWIGYAGPAIDPGGGLSKALSRYGIADAQTMNIEGLDERKRIVAANFGIGLFPVGNVEQELRQKSLCVVRVPSIRVVVPFALIRRQGVYLGKGAEHLERLLANAFA